MQLVVVMAVRKAVSAATITFTATSTIRFFMRHLPSHRHLNNPLLHASPPFRLILVEAIVTVVATVVATTGVVTASGIGTATLLATLRTTLAL